MLRYTLLTDGSSDRALRRIIDWVLASLIAESGGGVTFVSDWADFRALPRPPRSLGNRIALAIEYYPCDLLFIHRDAEREPFDVRADEIRQALGGQQLRCAAPIHLIPVRMMEAWLLFDEQAIREAAENSGSRVELDLPRITRIEEIADPKETLHQALRSASEYTGRRLRKFNVDKAVHRVAESTRDFSPLRQLAAFREFETSTRTAYISWCERRPYH